MNPQFWWFTARATGITAWILLSVSTIWGLLVSTKAALNPGPAWNLDLHRFLGGLAVAFTGIHLGGLVADNFVHFSWVETLVPWGSPWRTGAVTWGVFAFYLLLAVEGSSLMMRRLPRKFWRQIHISSFVLFVITTIHVFTAGTDRTNPALQWTGLVICTATFFLTVFRVLAPRRAAARARARAAQAPVAEAA